jgi:hypothetical protein
MALDADAAWPLKWEVSFLLVQAETASRLGLSGDLYHYAKPRSGPA